MTVTFAQTTWVAGVTPWSAANGNRIEQGIADCVTAVNALVPATGGTYTGVIESKGTGGLLAKYYNLRDPANDTQPQATDLIMSEILAGVDVTNRVPGGVTPFYAIVSGYIQPLYNENYTFYLTVDDSAKLYVDGFEIVGDVAWGSNGNGTFTGTSNLKSNLWVPVLIVHTNKSSGQRLKLEWASASQARQTIPSTKMKWDELSFRSSPVEKSFYADKGMYIAGGRVWSRNDLTVASSSPSGPNTNDIWIDTSISLP